MAAQSGRTDPSLDDVLFREGYRFNFFQAVRVLNWLYRDRSAVGHALNPSQEVVRFHSYPSLTFPPSPIYDVVPGEVPEDPVQITVAFMGLTGPQGVLPRHYTELILDRLRERDRTLLDFLDLFTHRFVALFYRSWEKYFVPVAYERAIIKKTGKDPVAEALSALVGLGTPGLKKNLEFNISRVLAYVGLIGQRPRSAIALKQMLQDYFQLPIQVDQFIGEWLNVSDADQTRLAKMGETNILGETTIAGSTVWDQQARFQLKVGPLELADFNQMLPSGTTYQAFVQLAQFFVGQEYNFDVRLVMKADEVPYCQLKETEKVYPRLGWTTWLKCEEFSEDNEDVVFAGEVGWEAPKTRRVAVA